MADIAVALEESGAKGRYVARVTGVEGEAEVTYSRAGETRLIIDHTAVPDSMRGMGVGEALVRRGVEDARAAGVTVIPLCPFAKSVISRHPELQDVLG